MSADVPSVDDFGLDRHRTTTGILSEAIGRIRDDSRLVLPFVVAGIVLSTIDWARRHDPIPTATSDQIGDVTVSITFLLYPSGAAATKTSLGSLVDLKLPYLLWAVGLELLAFLAVGIAGWLTMSRALGVEPSFARLRSYLGFVLLVQLAFRLLALLDGLGYVTLAAIVLAFAAFVRWFAAPALVVTGTDVRTALSRSSRLTAGRGVTVFGLVLAVGLSAWLFGSVPFVGAFVSSAAIAPIHAVAMVVFVDSAESAGM